MKIDQNRTSLDTVGGARAEQVRDEKAASTDKAKADDRRADQVRLSSTGQLAVTAAAAANEAPEIRPEAVARAKALLERGELGNDAGRLADALIDSLLDKG
jgi:flagellar biosynthesis anti-sigma factor FlgM